MNKTLSCIGLVLVLSVFGFTQTATAFEQTARGGHAPGELRPSHEQPPLRGGARTSFREDHNRPEAHFQRNVPFEHRLPEGYRTLKIANMILYYLDGIFYQPTPYGYVVVTPPPQAVMFPVQTGW